MISYHHLIRQIPRGHRLTRTAVLQPLPQEETCQRWVRAPFGIVKEYWWFTLHHDSLSAHCISWRVCFHLFILPSSLLPPPCPPLPSPPRNLLPSLNDIILNRFQRYCAVRQVCRQADGVYRPSLAHPLAATHTHILPSYILPSYHLSFTSRIPNIQHHVSLLKFISSFLHFLIHFYVFYDCINIHSAGGLGGTRNFQEIMTVQWPGTKKSYLNLYFLLFYYVIMMQDDGIY